MELIADMLMIAGAVGVAVYCQILAGRLKKLSTLESGMGGAIAVLSAQVDDLTRVLDKARGAANGSAASLESLTLRAEAAAAKLELMLATLHDLPQPPREVDPDGHDRKPRFVRRRQQREDLEAAE